MDVTTPMKGLIPGLWKAVVGKERGLTSLFSAFSRTAPQVTDHVEDSRKDLESQLKNSCEALIALQTQELCGELLKLFDEIAQPTDNTDSVNNPSNPEHLTKLTQILDKWTRVGPTSTEGEAEPAEQKAGKSLFEMKLFELLQTSHLYLDNPVTEKILFRPVKVSND